MRVLVTGANGYLGGLLFNYFSDLTDYQVIGACRRGASRFIGYGELNAQTEWASVLQNIDVVIHTAAIVHRRDVSESEYRAVNTDGTERLAKAASFSGVRLFIHISSVSVYGAYRGAPLHESDELSPVTPYARSKMLAEQRLSSLDAKMSRVILRCPMIYGSSAPGNSARLVWLLRKGMPIPVKGVENRRSFLSGSSVCEAVERIINVKQNLGCVTCNLTEPPASTESLVEAYANYLGESPFLISIPSPFARLISSTPGIGRLYRQLTDDYIVCGDEFKRQFGWSPEPGALNHLLREWRR